MRPRAAGGLLLLAALACRAPAPASRLAALDEVLRADRADDPRLDRDFEGLDAGTKALFRERYRSLPPERRAQRGTVVYLLGRNLTAPEDWEFLREVVSEPPCLSLADCSRAGVPGGEADDVTLAYPALVALRQAEKALGADAPPAAREGFLRALSAARGSGAPALSRMAEALARRHGAAVSQSTRARPPERP